MQEKTSLRNAVLELARERYGTEAEYLWAKTPTYAVLRHPNKKWYAALLDIPKSKLGLPGGDLVDILDLQCEPVMAGSLRSLPGIFPGYHMNKEKWITVLLDGTVDFEQITILLDMSYNISGRKSIKHHGGKENEISKEIWSVHWHPGNF